MTADPANVDYRPRIYIVGGPGSGKSTLGKRLARRYGIPDIGLDEIVLSEGHDKTFRPCRPIASRIESLRAATSSETGWLIEGSFLWWTEEFMEQADVLVWLDISRWLAAWRVAARHVRDYVSDILRAHGFSGRLRAARYPHVAFICRFMIYTWRYYSAGEPTGRPVDADDLSRASTALALDRFQGKLIRLGSTSHTTAITSKLNGAVVYEHSK